MKWNHFLLTSLLSVGFAECSWFCGHKERFITWERHRVLNYFSREHWSGEQCKVMMSALISTFTIAGIRILRLQWKAWKSYPEMEQTEMLDSPYWRPFSENIWDLPQRTCWNIWKNFEEEAKVSLISIADNKNGQITHLKF
jgi:hypothetical protein